MSDRDSPRDGFLPGEIHAVEPEPEIRTLDDVAGEYVIEIKPDCMHLDACRCAQRARSRSGTSLPLDCRWCKSHAPRKGGATLAQHRDRSHGK